MYIASLIGIFVAERARLVCTSLASQSSHLDTRLLLNYLPARAYFPCFLLCLVCVRVSRARHGRRARRRRGDQRVLADREKVGRSAVAVLVARRRMSMETRRKHECAPSGLLVWGRLYYVRVHKGLGLQNTFQAVLIFATKLKFTEIAPQSEHQPCRAGERGPP